MSNAVYPTVTGKNAPFEDFIDFEVSDSDTWKIPQSFDVLIVEDDIATTRYIKAIASKANSSVRTRSFKTAEEALFHLQLLRSHHLIAPDLAIIDIYLKGAKDGFAVYEKLAKYFPETTVVITSSMHPKLFNEKVEKLKSRPMFLPKPFSIQQLANLFKRLN